VPNHPGVTTPVVPDGGEAWEPPPVRPAPAPPPAAEPDPFATVDADEPAEADEGESTKGLILKIAAVVIGGVFGLAILGGVTLFVIANRAPGKLPRADRALDLDD
jgi:hypothetical protein